MTKNTKVNAAILIIGNETGGRTSITVTVKKVQVLTADVGFTSA